MGDAPDLLLHSPSPLLPLERAGSSQTQGLPATSKQTAMKCKAAPRFRVYKPPRNADNSVPPCTPIPPIRTTRPLNHPDKNTPGGANANNKPRRFTAANSEPPRRTARCNHLMDLLMPSMPGKPRPASWSRRRAQGHSPPARCNSCRNRASWHAGPWCS